MTTKKNASGKGLQDATSTDREMNEIYTAHQVHTLAQLTFQQLTASRQVASPGYGNTWPAPSGSRAMSPGASPAFFYWYP